MRGGERPDLDAILDGWIALLATGHGADPRFRPHPAARRVLHDWALDRWFAVFHPFPPVRVAEAGGAVIGWIAGEAQPELPVLARGPVARIDNLWVEPGHRRRGVGRSLVASWREHARRAGYLHHEVGTLSADPRALAFWGDLGFAPWRVCLLAPP